MRTHSMIDTLCQLTLNELPDIVLFENVVGEHFEKFRYFYDSMKVLPLKIKETSTLNACITTDHSIEISIDFENSNNRDVYLVEMLNTMKVSSLHRQYFDFTASAKNKKTLNIVISNKIGMMEEGEMYEDRFDSY